MRATAIKERTRVHPADDPLLPPAAATAGRDLQVAGVVHDANQMLAVITGRAGLLLRKAPEHREHLEAILLAAADAAAMLRRVGGEPDATTRPAAEISAVVTEAALLAAPGEGGWSAPGHPRMAGCWTLEQRLAPGAWAALPPPVLREVLVNLLTNALAALPGGGRLVIEATCRGNECRLSVADDGPGLPVDDPEAVFAAGFTTSGRAGRGIGLASCRQLLAAHGATLSAAKSGGPGAVFTIVAPACPPPAPAVPPLAAAAAGAPAAPGGLPVLVIDDETSVREMLADVLAELGCQVTCHRDGAGALDAGAPGGAALALVDCRLPGLDGPAVAARLRERAPGLVVALMTGWDREEDLPAPGSADFLLRKPLAVEALQDLLRQADALRQERRGAAGPAPGGEA